MKSNRLRNSNIAIELLEHFNRKSKIILHILSTVSCVILEEGEGDPEISAASIHLGLRKGRPQAK